MKHTRILLVVAAVLSLLGLGAIGGGEWVRRDTAQMAASMSHQPTVTEKPPILYWYDPMQPDQHFDSPGKSPFMDMDLVPKFADEQNTLGGVEIAPGIMQNLGVRLATVTSIPFVTQLEAVGEIGFNERNVAVVQSRRDGFVERVWPLAPGDTIKAGQPLAELLVPEWSAAQHELLAVKTSRDESLIAAARERLRSLGMAEKAINELEKSGVVRKRFVVNAPIAGVIQSLDVRTGMTVMAGQSVARINGLDTVWLEAAVPEARADTVRDDAIVHAYLPAFPAIRFQGRVTAILPTLNETVRTLRVRIELTNTNRRLRPGLSAQVTIFSARPESVLALPTEAIIRTGKRARVMVVSGQNRFSPVEVTLGREIRDQTVITSGVGVGQQVVASGQFLIDSEARLNRIEAPLTGAASDP